jgi:DNA polymerase I-like protein with 3'-5' exonuclease and polymerase domains
MPTKEAITACAPRLRRELENVNTIIAAGAEAAKELAGVSSISGSRGYGHRYVHGNGNQQVVVTNNPAVVLKDDSSFPNLVRDFRLALKPLPQPTLPEVTWTNAPLQARAFARSIIQRLDTQAKSIRPLLSVDIESKGLNHTAGLASIGFSLSGLRAFAFGYKVLQDRTFVTDYLRAILERTDCDYLWHNGKFDIRNLRHKGINARVDEDTLLLSYACDERSDEEQVHSLEYLVKNELGWPRYEPEEVLEWKRKVANLEKALKFKQLDDLAVPDSLYEYNGMDAAGTAQLYPILKQRAIDDDVYDSPYKLILLRGSEGLTRLELTGVHYDLPRASDMLEDEVLPQLDEYRGKLQLIVGDGEYNPNSAVQNSNLVYDKWGVIPQMDTKRPGKERSVDKPVYTALKEGRFNISLAVIGNPHDTIRTETRKGDRQQESGFGQSVGLVEQELETRRQTVERFGSGLADFKELDKQRSTYLSGLIPIAEAFGGRLYTSLKLHGTATGRTSSSRPNLQNITRAKAGLPNIRSLFRASEGCRIISADYSQAELRCIAYMSGDVGLTRIYQQGISLHKQVAERFYGPNYTYEDYVHAKNMDFGVAYGQSAETFREKHDVPLEEGRKFRVWWWEEFPGVADWRDDVHAIIKQQGYITNPFNRRRRFHLITDENKDAILREGFNFVPQSTASDFTIDSVCILVDELDWSKCPLWITVHDSIVGDCKEDYIEEAAIIFKQVMESRPKERLGWDLPFEAEVSIGPTWGELQDYALS